MEEYKPNSHKSKAVSYTHLDVYKRQVCRKERYIAWSDMRKKIVYEGEGTQK